MSVLNLKICSLGLCIALAFPVSVSAKTLPTQNQIVITKTTDQALVRKTKRVVQPIPIKTRIVAKAIIKHRTIAKVTMPNFMPVLSPSTSSLGSNMPVLMDKQAYNAR